MPTGGKANMKRIIMTSCIIAIMVFLGACGASTSSANSNSNSNQDYFDLLLSEDSFSDEFNNSEGFQSIKTDVIGLYNLVIFVLY